MTVNKERMELWVQALESDRYRQCTNVLRDAGDPEAGIPEMHCALGVGMAVAVENGCKLFDPWAWEHPDLDPNVVDWYGLNRADPVLNGSRTVVQANDEDEESFWTIAQELRETYLKDEG